ncbi:helix-turn-helix domain-containing protein [Photobacterium alginatilyticum]|uniref:Helix-turn-helix domain-containing protein n=2 Tax=Photobacterium alginatilyticum TaxID=1775171 RepID=A0ABW9YJE7_9GAMM|nr:helix-turn-helix domain-containing protein [Photobacterium alginatilyticum]
MLQCYGFAKMHACNPDKGKIVSSNKSFSVMFSQAVGSSYFRIGHDHWHIEELLSLQHLLLLTAPTIKEGLLWWSKSVSLYDRSIYVEPTSRFDGLSLHFQSRTNTELPLWVHYLTQDLLEHISSFTNLTHTWQQTPSKRNSLIRSEYGESLLLHFDHQEIQVNATPDPKLFSLAKQFFLLLQHVRIEKEDLVCRLKKHIHDDIRSPLRLSDLAVHLGLSPRTLQRRLQEKQINFTTLVDNEKKSIALRLLADTQISVSSIANQLGYDDPSNFHRAFRKWYPFSPQVYREQCRTNRVIQQNNPIRLHYATAVVESSTGKQGQSGRVWIEVDNIAFEKKVAVECEDRDGVWRRYPAFFDYFLADGIELWSTANLPVAHPLRFRLCYEVDGNQFIDDNLQRNFLVDEPMLLGHPIIVVPVLVVVPEMNGFRVVIQLACRLPDIETIHCHIDTQENNRWAMTKSAQNRHFSSWSLSTFLTAPPQKCHFEFISQQGEHLRCDNYQQGYLFTSPLS